VISILLGIKKAIMDFFDKKKKEVEEREQRHEHRQWKVVDPPLPSLALIRKYFTDKSTVGVLTFDGKFLCHTLEDTVRDLNKDGIFQPEEKIYAQTAIPAGHYEVVVNYSNKFHKYLPLLLNVPFFRGIRMHSGNTSEQSAGCILLGRYEEDIPDIIVDSRMTFSKIFPMLEKKLKRGKIFIDIIGGNKVEPTT